MKLSTRSSQGTHLWLMFQLVVQPVGSRIQLNLYYNEIKKFFFEMFSYYFERRVSGVCSALWRWWDCCVWAVWCANWTATWNTERPCWFFFSASTCWWLIGWPAYGIRSAVRMPTTASSTVGYGSWPTWPSRRTLTSGQIKAIHLN